MSVIAQQKTVSYKTYIKTALVEAVGNVFANHVDALLANTKVTVEYPHTRADYPSIIVKFSERDLRNAGVGHIQWIDREVVNPVSGLTETRARPYKHYLYSGDINFGVLALSSIDRDLISDSLVQIISMGDLTGYTNRFFNRIYNASVTDPTSPNYDPYTGYHYININTDQLTPSGDGQQIVPWQSEDALVYQTGYGVGITGEFYSLTPSEEFGYVAKVNEFPYLPSEAVSQGTATDPAPWL